MAQSRWVPEPTAQILMGLGTHGTHANGATGGFLRLISAKQPIFLTVTKKSLVKRKPNRVQS